MKDCPLNKICNKDEIDFYFFFNFESQLQTLFDELENVQILETKRSYYGNSN